MKTLKLIPILLAIATGSLISSCERSRQEKMEDRIDNNNSRIDNTKNNVEDEYDKTFKNEKPIVKDAEWDNEWREFKADAEDRISKNDRDIADWKRKMKNEKAEVRAKYDKKIEALEEENWRMRRRMDEYKYDDKSGMSGWEKFKREFNHDMDELGTSLKNLGKDNVK
jgi:hypothetical protein